MPHGKFPAPVVQKMLIGRAFGAQRALHAPGAHCEFNGHLVERGRGRSLSYGTLTTTSNLWLMDGLKSVMKR